MPHVPEDLQYEKAALKLCYVVFTKDLSSSVSWNGELLLILETKTSIS